MAKPRIIGPVPDCWTDSVPKCERCGRPINRMRCAWLELDQRTNTYHDREDVPEAKSQGWFPFGIACATKILAKAEGR